MSRPRPVLLSALLALALAGAASPAKAAKKAHRPRVDGHVVPDALLRQAPLPPPSGNLHIYNVNTHEELKINIFNTDGSYNVESLESVTHLLRCRRTDDEKPIDARLLALLSHVYDHYGGKRIELLSGYRNQRRITSNHFKGKASDIRILGVEPRRLRDFVATLDNGGMGIGIYPRSGFVHVDVRPPPSYRWVDWSRSNPNSPDKLPPRGWKHKKLES